MMQPVARSTIGRTAQGALLVLLGCLMALTIVEAGVRVFDPQPPLLYYPDPNLGWVHPTRYRVTYPGRSGMTDVRFNSMGLRDGEHAHEKRQGVLRVLVLGDSYAEGVDVELAQTFAKQLERLLRHDMRGEVEVINAGVGGYGTDQEYLYLTREGVKYDPDVVLLAFTIANDVHDNAVKGYCRVTPSGLVCAPPAQGRAKRIWVAVKAFLQQHFQTYFFVRTTTAHWYPVRLVLGTLGLTEFKDAEDATHRLPAELRVFLRQPGRDLDDGWTLTTAILERIHEAAKTHGARLAIALIPADIQVDAGRFQQVLRSYGVRASDFDLERPNRILQHFSRAHGIPVVDLLPAFHEATVRGESLSKGHWTPAGHRLAAEQMCTALAKSGLLNR